MYLPLRLAYSVRLVFYDFLRQGAKMSADLAKTVETLPPARDYLDVRLRLICQCPCGTTRVRLRKRWQTAVIRFSNTRTINV